jgi:cob(I)alamin adenosyltransferase
MGVLATAVEDLPRYDKDGYPRITAESTRRAEAFIGVLEAGKLNYRGWATPGATAPAAALDLARTVCRRAERHICGLEAARQLANPEIIVFLNRVSDWLWLLARERETRGAAAGGEPSVA